MAQHMVRFPDSDILQPHLTMPLCCPDPGPKGRTKIQQPASSTVKGCQWVLFWLKTTELHSWLCEWLIVVLHSWLCERLIVVHFENTSHWSWHMLVYHVFSCLKCFVAAVLSRSWTNAWLIDPPINGSCYLQKTADEGRNLDSMYLGQLQQPHSDRKVERW